MNSYILRAKIKDVLRRWREFDLYPAMRPLLFRLDAEQAHNLAIWALHKGFGPKFMGDDDPILNSRVCGLDFANPIGLAAGFDKQCKVIGEAQNLGFGFTELGGVVPLPQPGNPRPRLFRIPEVQGIINRFDFNSDGFDVCERRVAAWHDASFGTDRGIIGINIAKGNHYEDAAEACILGLKTFANYVNYVTINVSCPNTPGLRNLEGREQLADLLKKILATREGLAKKSPVFVKISPDQTPQQAEDIAEAVLEAGVDAVIVGNTTVTRPGAIPPDLAKEKGGFSGPAMMAPTTQLLANMYKLTQGKVPLIGNCGIFTGSDAYAKIRAGASLVQLYTALVYEGPGVVVRIKRDLAALLRRDGFATLGDAVGADHR